jgi:hypothetical protein
MIITIARKCGCYGDTIGEELAKKYGIAFYDKEKISELAKEKGVYDKYPDYYGEIPEPDRSNALHRPGIIRSRWSETCTA